MKSTALSQDSRTRYAQTIFKNSKLLMRLVDHLYEYSQLQSNEIVPHIEPFSIQELISDNSSRYELIADALGVDVKIDMPRDLPLVLGDIALIDRVLQNLIDNALKFCGAGDCIRIGAVTDESIIELFVADTGPGIPTHLREIIFERFVKKKVAPGETYTGIGLGLDIVREILELHDTSIVILSNEPKGTVFSFKLQRY